jgi:hypothetical protein
MQPFDALPQIRFYPPPRIRKAHVNHLIEIIHGFLNRIARVASEINQGKRAQAPFDGGFGQ